MNCSLSAPEGQLSAAGLSALDRDGRALRAAIAESNREIEQAAAEQTAVNDDEIEGHARVIDSLKARGIETILKIGEHLAAVHELLAGNGRDGAFGPWIRERCGFSTRSGYNYIGAFETFGNKCETVSHLFDARAVYVLSADSCPEKAVAEALRKAKKGQKITAKLAAELKRKHTPTPDDDGEAEPAPTTDDPPEGEVWGKGVYLANEAIACLQRIPKNDALRVRAFEIVSDWIRHNQ